MRVAARLDQTTNDFIANDRFIEDDTLVPKVTAGGSVVVAEIDETTTIDVAMRLKNDGTLIVTGEFIEGGL
jgi:hypothetical protein